MVGISEHTPKPRFFDAQFLHIARNSSWSIAGTFVVAAGTFAETIILGRYLGAANYGVYLLVLAFPEVVQFFLDFRTREAMTRFLGGSLERADAPRAVAVVKLLWIVDFGVVVTALLIVVVTAPIVAPHLTGNPEAPHLMKIYAIALLLGGLDATAGAVLRVFDRFRLAFLASVSSFALRLMIVIELVDRGSGLEGLVWGRVAAELVTTLIVGTAAFMMLKKALWSHRGAPLSALRGLRREILHFLVHMNLQGSLRAVATKLDVLCVGVLAGPGAVGLYKVAVQLGSSPLLFADPLFIAVYPLFSRWQAAGRAADIRSVGRKSSITLAAIAVPTVAVLVIGSEQLLTFLFGPDFAAAALPMTIVLVGVLPSVLFFWGRAAILALGDARKATMIVTTATIAQFAALFALTPVWGATGAAVGFALTSVVSVVMTGRYLHRKELL